MIRLLYLEDVPADAAKFDRELQKAGLVFQSSRVDTREAFLRALDTPPDVILSDHGLPAFDGLTALAAAREKCPDVPFIFVTNALTREMEIEKLAGVVSDYVPKSSLVDLPAAVQRALRIAENNRSRRQLLEALCAQAALAAHGKLLLPICAGCKRIRDSRNQWKPPEAFFRELLKLEYTHGLCPDCLPKYFPNIETPGNPPA